MYEWMGSYDDKSSFYTLPTTLLRYGVSENFKNSDITATALFSVFHDFSEVVAIGYNLGLNLDPEQDLSFRYSASAGFSLTEQLSTFVEIFGNWYNFRSTSVGFDLGLTCLLNDNLQLDVSYGRGINYQTNFLSLGVSWRIMPN